jgi:hypothetical protein
MEFSRQVVAEVGRARVIISRQACRTASSRIFSLLRMRVHLRRRSSFFLHAIQILGGIVVRIRNGGRRLKPGCLVSLAAPGHVTVAMSQDCGRSSTASHAPQPRRRQDSHCECQFNSLAHRPEIDASRPRHSARMDT